MHYALDELLYHFDIYDWCSIDGWLGKKYGIAFNISYLIDIRDNYLKKRKEKKRLSLYSSLNEFMHFFYLYFQYSKDRCLEEEHGGLVMESGFYIS